MKHYATKYLGIHYMQIANKYMDFSMLLKLTSTQGLRRVLGLFVIRLELND